MSGNFAGAQYTMIDDDGEISRKNNVKLDV